MDEMAKAWGFDGAGEFCHGGMLNAADCIAKDLYRHQVRACLRIYCTLACLLVSSGRERPVSPYTSI